MYGFKKVPFNFSLFIYKASCVRYGVGVTAELGPEMKDSKLKNQWKNMKMKKDKSKSKIFKQRFKTHNKMFYKYH